MLEVAYGLYARRVYTLCLRLLAGVIEAEEATVQVFTQLRRELARRWDEAYVLKRLIELAVNEALRLLRTRAPERFDERAIEWGSMSAVNVESTSENLNGARSAPPGAVFDPNRLDALTARLQDDLRVAFVLGDREGLSHHEVASYLQVGEAEARSLIHKARLELLRMFMTIRTQEEEVST